MSSRGSKMLLNRNAGIGPGAGLGAAEELGVERSFGSFEGVFLVAIVRFGGMMKDVVSRDVHSMLDKRRSERGCRSGLGIYARRVPEIQHVT